MTELLEHTRALLVHRLNAVLRGWSPSETGLVGPGSLAIRLLEHHEPRDHVAHVDIGFVLNRDRTDVPILWDCASGIGATVEARAKCAVDLWAMSTLPVVLEFLEGQRQHAEHLDHDDPDGISGWHVLCGPIVSFGGSEAAHLREWVCDHVGVLSKLKLVLDDRPIHTLKLVLGPVHEVRVDGLQDARATATVASLPWPRANDGYVRWFLLALQPAPANT